MGIVVSFNRVSDAELARVIAEPESYWEVVDSRDRAAEPSGYLDKAWHGLSYLLGRSGTGIDLFMGGDPIENTEGLTAWSAQLVRETAQTLRGTPFSTLAAHYEPTTLEAAGIYPNIWAAEGEEALDYLREYYDVLVKFFGSAADAESAAVMSMG
ncbi:YfbM family protein [Nocardia sp. CA-290969]|uniref:YfbM family protein n=1 Tax=Nocardia sp. CA-290969 TaxID=3239986 RepID=UPI003D906C06